MGLDSFIEVQFTDKEPCDGNAVCSRVTFKSALVANQAEQSYKKLLKQIFRK